MEELDSRKPQAKQSKWISKLFFWFVHNASVKIGSADLKTGLFALSFQAVHFYF